MFLQWVLPKATYLEQLVSYQSSSIPSSHAVFQSGSIRTTGVYLARDVIIINDWFFRLWNMTKGYVYYLFSESFLTRMEEIVYGILLLCCVWFSSSKREPPDKSSTTFLSTIYSIFIEAALKFIGSHSTLCIFSGISRTALTTRLLQRQTVSYVVE